MDCRWKDLTFRGRKVGLWLQKAAPAGTISAFLNECPRKKSDKKLANL